MINNSARSTSILLGVVVVGIVVLVLVVVVIVVAKSKAFPLQACRGPECSRNLRFPDYVILVQDGGKFVGFTHRPLFTPRKYSWYSFLLEAESTPGP